MAAVKSALELPGYEIRGLLGEGAYGSVYEALRCRDRRRVAIKRVIFDMVPDEIEEILREISFMSVVNCDHPNLVAFYEAVLHPVAEAQHRAGDAGAAAAPLPSLCIVQELVDGGTIHALMKALRAPLTESEVAAVTCDVLRALAHLHDECRIVHRDVKTSNLLLCVGDAADGEPRVKMCDFGAGGALAAPNAARHTLIGTPGWMAPEVLGNFRGELAVRSALVAGGGAGAPPSSQPGGTPSKRDGGEAPLGAGHSFPSDVWSLGVSIIEMLLARSPHEDPLFSQIVKQLSSQPLGSAPSLGTPQLDAKYTPLCREFVRQCLTLDPLARPTAHALLSHPFIAQQLGDNGAIRRKSMESIVAKLVSTPEFKRRAASGAAARHPHNPDSVSTAKASDSKRVMAPFHSAGVSPTASGGRRRGAGSESPRLRNDQIAYSPCEIHPRVAWTAPPPSLQGMIVAPPSLASSKAAFDRVLIAACRRGSLASHRIATQAFHNQQQLMALDTGVVPAVQPSHERHASAFDSLIAALRSANDVVPNFTVDFVGAIVDATAGGADDEAEASRVVRDVAVEIARRPPVSSHRLPEGDQGAAGEQQQRPLPWAGHPRMPEATGLHGLVELTSPAAGGRVEGGSSGGGGIGGVGGIPGRRRRRQQHSDAVEERAASQRRLVSAPGVLYNAWLDERIRQKFEGRQAFHFSPFM